MGTKIIGLTGGIGSGKSTMANYFESLGVPVYIADEEAKKILYLPEAVNEVRKVFGEEVFTEQIPDRAKLAKVVFNDPDKLKQLNEIIHPKVRDHFTNWVKLHKSQNFVIKEAAILFESGSYKNCNKVILVTAPKDLRIKRVMERDKVTKEQVLERMSNQWDEKKKEELSDYIIYNTDLEAAKNKAKEIFLELNKM
ncbi:dephospho-CoA kinase [Flavobacterium alkalisoli]|uniref:Dephospho-CoA kinase n=1 Tax=Flavobacterium alkalisoli TaxID=2602769 RepID=A0A5B9FW26_9FLAO|nr:dephospho-CoA kinase [Flavobacterium alkalisoli]QEE49968.1 dephospho-CoA kinase [Flavobacterium alkalisoli]